MKKTTLLAFLLLTPLLNASAQEVFKLKNASFEKDKAGPGIIPDGWLNMGAPDESPPDIQPGMFDVTLKAQDGKVYLGLVVRDNNTWEGVGQRLDGYLKKDSAYTFSLYLARSNSFISMSRVTLQEATYNSPTVLKVWGVNTQTQQEELLAESEPVSHSQWTQYTFTLKPTLADFDEIDLMAYYAPNFEQRNGNLLIDHCSDIVPLPDRH